MVVGKMDAERDHRLWDRRPAPKTGNDKSSECDEAALPCFAPSWHAMSSPTQGRRGTRPLLARFHDVEEANAASSIVSAVIVSTTSLVVGLV